MPASKNPNVPVALRPPSAQTGRVHQPSVLVVDSHRDCRESLALALDLEGCRVRSLASKLETIVHLRTYTPNTIILDSHISTTSTLHIAHILHANRHFDTTQLIMTLLS